VRDNLFFGENWPNGDTASIFWQKIFLRKKFISQTSLYFGECVFTNLSAGYNFKSSCTKMSLVKVKYICLGTCGNVAIIRKWNEKKKKKLSEGLFKCNHLG